MSTIPRRALLRLLSTHNPSSTFYDSTIEKVHSTNASLSNLLDMQLAAQPLERLSLSQMVSFGQSALRDDSVLLQHARFVHREVRDIPRRLCRVLTWPTQLPKRLARRLLDLRFLPYIVVTNPHIKAVYDALYVSFRSLLEIKEIKTSEDNAKLTQVLQNRLDQHGPLLDSLSAGLRECLVKKVIADKVNLQPVVENMLRSRISRRVMAAHHIGLHSHRDGYIGCICEELDVNEAILNAATRARAACKSIYGSAPEVRVEAESRILMPYIPGHMDYMLLELFKNSMKASMINRTKGRDIHVKICDSESSVTIKISDQGGGIPPADQDRIWDYGFSNSADQESTGSFWTESQEKNRSELSGYGFGLPLARLHARYFGGELQLVSIPEFGVDVFLTTSKLGRNVCSKRAEEEEKLSYTLDRHSSA